ncbi:MAG: hypothetical protein COA79_17360 [Planctomycetota bacterium]|nr:MAG: hypothetical protein COA79_17360 [Planctomycetota bacterium]
MITKSIKLILFTFIISSLLISCGSGGGTTTFTVTDADLQKILGSFAVTETYDKTTFEYDENGAETSNKTTTELDEAIYILTDDESKKCDVGQYFYIGGGIYPLEYSCVSDDIARKISLTIDPDARKMTYIVTATDQTFTDVDGTEIKLSVSETEIIIYATDYKSYTGTINKIHNFEQIETGKKIKVTTTGTITGVRE